MQCPLSDNVPSPALPGLEKGEREEEEEEEEVCRRSSMHPPLLCFPFPIWVEEEE